MKIKLKMNANNNNKQQKSNSNSCEKDISKEMNKFHMGIKDEFTDPLENNCFDNFEDKMLKNFRNAFNDDFNLLGEEEKNSRKEEEKQKENKMTNGTVFSKVYCSSYSNINGKPQEECYQSQSMKQMENGHNISEAREAYKNSDGLMKSAYQRGLDEKGARFIKEKNAKTGQHNQHKILKGLKDNEIENFNKEYNDYSKKCGFKNNYKALNAFGPHMKRINNHKQIADGKTNKNRN